MDYLGWHGHGSTFVSLMKKSDKSSYIKHTMVTYSLHVGLPIPMQHHKRSSVSLANLELYYLSFLQKWQSYEPKCNGGNMKIDMCGMSYLDQKLMHQIIRLHSWRWVFCIWSLIVKLRTYITILSIYQHIIAQTTHMVEEMGINWSYNYSNNTYK